MIRRNPSKQLHYCSTTIAYKAPVCKLRFEVLEKHVRSLSFVERLLSAITIISHIREHVRRYTVCLYTISCILQTLPLFEFYQNKSDEDRLN